jgi:molybdopterin synthase sulfur carrier subunit
MARVRLVLFASAREAAGTASDTFAANDVSQLLAAARERYGPEFSAVLASSRIWHNADEPADGDATELVDGDEIAVLPPVSGG